MGYRVARNHTPAASVPGSTSESPLAIDVGDKSPPCLWLPDTQTAVAAGSYIPYAIHPIDGNYCFCLQNTTPVHLELYI